MKLLISLTLFGYMLHSQPGEQSRNSPISILSIIQQKQEVLETPELDFDPEWVDSLKLILPCDGVSVPRRTMRLPNAPRDYRSGTHRGIDFFATWGTPVKAVADGVVIRADHYYVEVPAEFRENLLSTSARIGNTPSDIFNSVLLGKAVFLDHGFDLVTGFRVITIYAHLSHIENNVNPGNQIKGGDFVGNSGNTGMRESTLGSKAGSHLHWEMILQKGEQEIYLGHNIPNPELYNMLTAIFN